MTPQQNAAPVAAPSASAEAKTEATTVVPPRDEFDPLGWGLPLLCKDCGKLFDVPYRHFQAGVVFHCSHCHGSFVPKTEMCRAVREAFDDFYARQRRRLDDRADKGDSSTPRIEARELEEFRAALERLAREMRPAGKMVRRKGLRAMFT
jgi:hypothetical protein